MKKHVGILGATLLASTTLLGAGQAFAAGGDSNDPSPAQTSTEVTVNLEMPDNGGTNPVPPTPPTNPDTPDPDNPGNKPNNPTGAFGIAYQPDIFAFGDLKLNESGEQEKTANLPKTGDTKFHVGVKDKTRETKGWTLTAKLAGSLSEQPGVSIAIGNGTGTVKVNKGDTSSSNLVDAPEGFVTGESTVNVNQTAATVMSGNKDKVHNDVYDYELGTPTLKIADAQKVQAKNYTGSTVVWDLAVVPDK